jgi:hypothetical protein
MSNIKHCPPPSNAFLDRFGQSSFETAARIDTAYFKAHPGSKKYQRHVIRGEVPPSLRSKRIRTVLVGQIADGVILYGFANGRGAVVGQSLFIDKQLFSTAAGRKEANFCLNLFKTLSSLQSGDDR